MSFPFLAATLIYCAMIFLLSSISSFPVSPPQISFFDKIVHFLLFAGLSALVAVGLYQARHCYSPKLLFFIPVSFSLVYSISDEIHQVSVPLREFSLGDLVADATGAAAAAGVLLFVHHWKKLKRNQLKRRGL